MASAATLPNLYQGVDKDSFGYKLIAKFGWKEGQGLGANKQGITEHLKVKKKQDALGVGAAEHVHKLRDWTTGMVGFDAILTGLKEITRDEPSSSSDSGRGGSGSSGDQGNSSGYDSKSGTAGDAGKSTKQSIKHKKQKSAQKAADKKTKKKQRNATSNLDAPVAKKSKKAAVAESDPSDSDPNLDDAAAAAAGLSAPAKVTRVKAASHVGRYQKREKAKTVRNYSAQDLAAILGLPGSAPPGATGEGSAGWAAAAVVTNTTAAREGRSSSHSGSSSSSSSSSDSDDSDDAGQAGSEQRLRPGTPPGSDTPPARVQQQQGSGDEALKTADPCEDDAEEAAVSAAWWRSVFIRAGRTGGAGPAAVTTGKQRIIISGFQEQDQTNLYMQAHEGASKGKQGLGRSGMPKKVAGTRWAGKKIKLGSDSEDGDQEEQQQQQQQQATQGDTFAVAAAAAGREVLTKHGIVIVMPVKNHHHQQQQQQAQEGSTAAVSHKKKSKKGKGKSKDRQQQQQQQEKPGSSLSRKRRRQEPTAAAAAEPSSSSGKKSKQAKQQQEQAEAVGQQQQQQPNVKWAKLAAKILEDAPRKRMRVQKLHRKVVAAAGFDVDASDVDAELLFKQMLKKLRKAGGLAVCDKYVGLAA